MKDALFLFLQYRISMVFMLAFILILAPLRYSVGVSALLCAVSFCLTTLGDHYTFYTLGQAAPSLAVTAVQVLLVQGLVLLLARRRNGAAVFTGVTASTYVLVGNLAATFVQQFLHSAVLALLAEVVLHLAVLLVIAIKLRSAYQSELQAHPRDFGRFIYLPMLIYASVYAAINWPSDIHTMPTNWAVSALILLQMLVSYLLLFRLLQKRAAEAQLKEDVAALSTYAAGMRREMELMRRSEKQLSIYRHDTRHVYNLLSVYLNAGETESARALLRQKNAALEGTSVQHYCENITINGILSGVVQRAREAKVAFTVCAEVPAQLGRVDEFEFAIVLLNLLENALNATGKLPEGPQRQMKLRLFVFKQQLVLEITNNCDGNTPLDPETGLPLPAEGEEHGYGLRSVQAFAAKNDSVFKVAPLGDSFRVRLMVRL